jgi:glycogen phosphorylase
LFRQLDPAAWEAAGGNPVRLVALLDAARVAAVLDDPDLLRLLIDVSDDFEHHRRRPEPWFVLAHGSKPIQVAYFAAEFALADCLPIFAGGLGAVAGELLKSASALGVPVVGVGLLYRETSHQWLDAERNQQETWESLDTRDLPIALARTAEGRPLEVRVPLPGRHVVARVWQVDVGGTGLILLDTDVPLNQPQDRTITRRLYPSELGTKLRQELVLGLGGPRALHALGIEPTVVHLNEGHAAFAALERIGGLAREEGLGFDEAVLAAAPGLVFTTHTPVAAGHDYFTPQLANHYLGPVTAELGLPLERVLALGRHDPDDPADSFCPTVLALRLCARRNGVSALHGRVTSHLWRGLWPRVPESEIPVEHVTNGVHLQSWVSPELSVLFDATLGERWRTTPGDVEMWARIDDLPDEELWATRQGARERLVQYARRSLRDQFVRRGADPETLAGCDTRLDPNALTIGFVCRFVAYKRPTLFLADRDRLARLLRSDDRPVQMVFAGKAHPQDGNGKELLREVVQFARDAGVADRVVFLEDFDVGMDRHLSQGADVWLSTPGRPEEACGIGGMKSGINGGLNLSTLDGWWDEAYRESDPPIGWPIGTRDTYDDPARQAAVDAASLYDRLEQEIVPAYYERDASALPRRWIASMKASMSALAPMWSSHRMVQDYAQHIWVPQTDRVEHLLANDGAEARDLAQYLGRLRAAWPEVHVLDVACTRSGDGSGRAVATVALGSLAPSDVAVQLRIDHGDGRAAVHHLLRDAGVGPGGGRRFALTLEPGTLKAESVIAVRVLPSHPGLDDPLSTGIVRWSGDS